MLNDHGISGHVFLISGHVFLISGHVGPHKTSAVTVTCFETRLPKPKDTRRLEDMHARWSALQNGYVTPKILRTDYKDLQGVYK